MAAQINRMDNRLGMNVGDDPGARTHKTQSQERSDRVSSYPTASSVPGVLYETLSQRKVCCHIEGSLQRSPNLTQINHETKTRSETCDNTQV